MMQKFRTWIFSNLQVKVLFLISSVMLFLLAVFVFYNVQIERAALEEALQQKGTSMALTGATAVGHFLEDAIAHGQFTEAEIFDTNYQPIPNTNPQKYNTAYDDFTDTNLLAIQDIYLEDPDVLFAVTVDTNGYLPTHNTPYSNPLTGDYETDLSGNRTKRIFDDEVGISAAKNTEPSLFQVYFRDTGEVAWDISAPIWVNNRHWGAFRVSFSLEDIEAQTAALAWQTIIAAGVVVIAIGLASFLIARQIARPISNLTVAAQKFGEGDLDVKFEVKSQDQVGQLGHEFNQMASQLTGLIDTLEQQVAERTHRLEIITELSGQLAAILDFDQLLIEMVNQVKDSFDYYHAQVYITDNNRQNLVMTAGVGEAGAAMKAKDHQIPLNAPTSLVARSARTGEIVSVDNVREAEDWLPNPLLPDTYSEMAVPIILDGQVVGILDVQEDEIAGLDEGDAGLLRSLANQVAVAIRNARLFENVESALFEARAAQEQYVEQSWDRTKVARQNKGQVRFSVGESTTLTEESVTQARNIAMTSSKPTAAAFDNGNDNAYVAPIVLRNIPIGNLQLHGFEDDTDLSDGDTALVEAIIDQVAQAAENLRLIGETQERAGREQLITRVSDKLRRAPDIETLMNIGVQEIAQVLGSSRTFVQLGSEDELGKKALKLPETVGNINKAESTADEEIQDVEADNGQVQPVLPTGKNNGHVANPVEGAGNGQGDTHNE